ncbi:MAG: cytochrome-c oxidase, cbb3-type subunit III [Magnetococcus sp. WYHC-3]
MAGHMHTQDGTTGHQWDDEEGAPLKEWNNPLPAWWLYTFYATIIWSIIYWVIYPAWPVGNGATQGITGWTMYTELQEELDAADVQRKPFLTKLDQTDLAQVNADPKLFEFAKSGGKAIFGDYCAACHGSGGTGGKGFPNLTDNDWIYGGTYEAILETLNNGRAGMMPAHLDAKGGAFSAGQVDDLVNYVQSLSNMEHDAMAAERGKTLFMGDAGCNNCHGDTGVGALLGSAMGNKLDASVGAPNLTDRIWLYGSDKETIRETISAGRNGRMPAWGTGFDGLGKQMTPLQLKQLAVYVHSLGGGQ